MKHEEQQAKKVDHGRFLTLKRGPMQSPLERQLWAAGRANSIIADCLLLQVESVVLNSHSAGWAGINTSELTSGE